MNEVENLLKNHKPLALALVIVLAVVGYALYKKAQAAQVAATPPASAPASTVGPGGTFSTTYDTTTITNSTTTPPVKPSPIPPMGKPAWLPAIPNGSRLIANWGGLPWGWQAPHSKLINGLNPPAGTRIWQGSAGRWWYAVPGGPETLLTTN